MSPANDNDGSTVHDKLDLLLAEQKLLREQVSKLVVEVRVRKRAVGKRVKTMRERSAERLVEKFQPTELDRARARKILARIRSQP